MVSLADANTILTERVIKEIHSLVLINDFANRGVYKRVPVSISGATHTPPQPYLVPEQMEAIMVDYEGIKRDKHIIESVAAFHLCFEGIHPFIDGNGRIGRLILNFELIRAGLLPVNIKFSERRKYYDCFEHYYSNGHTQDTLSKLVADYEAEELLKYIAILER